MGSSESQRLYINELAAVSPNLKLRSPFDINQLTRRLRKTLQVVPEWLQMEGLDKAVRFLLPGITAAKPPSSRCHSDTDN